MTKTVTDKLIDSGVTARQLSAIANLKGPEHGLPQLDCVCGMTPSEEEIRALKSQGLSDNDIGDCFGITGGKIKNLRFKYNIPSPRLEVTRDRTVDTWPAVMSEAARAKHWARYFKRLGHDHSRDDLRFKSTGRVMPQPDRSHGHNLGATSLKQMESF